MSTIPAEHLFVDRYGILRIKERVLTIDNGQPALISFDEARMRIDSMPGDTPEARAVKIANGAVLARSMAKLMPYQGSDNPGNRILSHAKQHAILHRALWVRNLLTLDQDWSSSRYKKYITDDDLHRWPSLRDSVADPDKHYRDQRSEKSGHIMLKEEHVSDLLGWNQEVIDGIDGEKLQNRQAISGRLEMVPWMELPRSVELVLLTDSEATERFNNPIPDGVIPVTNSAAFAMKSMSRSGNPVSLKNGDKIRGGNILPFKGTVRRIPGKMPQIFLVEGGSLKVKITPGMPRRIKVTRRQVMEGAFAVETPSQERLIRNPRFGTHMMNLLIGQLRTKNPALAESLVPKISDRVIRLASGKATTLNYIELCLYPVRGHRLNRKLALDVCQQIIDGELVVPILRGEISVPGSDGITPYKFGITSAGRLLLRGVPPTYETVWEQIIPRIGAEIGRELRPRVSGIGGLAQGDPDVPMGSVVVSRKLGKMLKGARQATLMYWPAKFPHCLHKVDVTVNKHLDGSCICIHPAVLETLGGDSDGDLCFLVTEPSIVTASRSISDPVRLKDHSSGEIRTYPNMVEMVRSERGEAEGHLNRLRQDILRGQNQEVDGHERMAKVNQSADQIGMSFQARDLIQDKLGYGNHMVYTRLGMLCQEALDGLKLTTPVDIVQILLDSPGRLSEYLGIPEIDLPYDQGGMPAWRSNGRTRRMYQAWSNKRIPVSELLGASRAAKQDAESLFEWILSRTGLGEIELPRVLTRAQLREKAESLMHGRPAGEARKTKYELVRSRTMQVQEDGLFVRMESQPEVTLQDHRFGRVRYLLDHGVDPAVLRAVVMQKVSESSQSVEALGLLTALRTITRTSVSAEAAS
jgi:hypothetical protein